MPSGFQSPWVVWLIVTAAVAAAARLAVRRELRARAVVYGSFLIGCLVVLWPPHPRGGTPGSIRLGLDLRGGMHLVLQVLVDGALQAAVDDAAAAARREVAESGTSVSAQRVDRTTFVVGGVEPARLRDVREALKDTFRAPEWDIREPGDGSLLVRMEEAHAQQVKRETVKEAMHILELRVNQLGVAEPVIAPHGASGDQILVQLPGVTDAEQAKQMMIVIAQLSLHLVEDVAATRDQLLARTGGTVPPDREVFQGPDDEGGGRVHYLVRRDPMVTGRDLKTARAGVGELQEPRIDFTLKPRGAAVFAQETARNIGRRLAIVLDKQVLSAPAIEERIGAHGQIRGRFTMAEADELARVLRAGALPAKMRFLEERTVGASLGRDSIAAGIVASAAAMLLITAFMLGYYRLSGLNAVLALLANLVVLLAALAWTGAALTLPGIAGIVLTLGVGVDTNVLVFERIREELRGGKAVRAAVRAGFDRVVDHDPGHTRHRADRCRGPVPVRHRSHQGVRGHAGHGPGRERVRVLFREPVPVRVGPRQTGGLQAQHLTAGSHTPACPDAGVDSAAGGLP